MSRVHFERFWVDTAQLESGARWLDEHGFLLPREETGVSLLPLCDVDSRCVVLLGEPGMGKSVDLEKWSADSSDRILHDLGTFEPGDFREKIEQDPRLFDDAPERNLFLCLDGLDEASPQVLRKLPDFLGARTNKVAVRLACRTAFWEQQLDRLKGRLSDLYGVGFRVFVLAPPRWTDVPEDMRVHVENIGAQTLATTPLLHEFLRHMESSGPEKPTKRNLYESGCRHLLEEIRRPSQCVSSVEQRLILAKRLAVKALLSRTTAEVDNSDLLYRETTEDTGLFRRSGRFAHHSYAEFLAAARLATHVDAGEQGRRRRVQRVIDLLAHPRDPRRRIVPQLGGLAAWLAVMVDDIFEHLLGVEPELLLGADPRSLRDGQRGRLVARFVDSAGGELPTRVAWDLRTEGLRYSDVARQLRERLEDPSVSTRVRDNAALFAYRMGLGAELKLSLMARVLDRSEGPGVRIFAAHALSDSGGQLHSSEAATLVDALADAPDALRGATLAILWRGRHLDGASLPEHLLPVRRRNIYDSYSMFLRELARDLEKNSPEGIGGLIAWLEEQVEAGQSLDDEEDLVRAVIAAALRSSERDRLIAPIARLVVSTDHERWKLPQLDPSTRRAIMRAMVDHLVDRGERHATHSLIQLVAPKSEEEVRWILSELEAAPVASAESWVQLLFYAVDYTEPRTWEPVADAAQMRGMWDTLRVLVSSDLETTGWHERVRQERQRVRAKEREARESEQRRKLDEVAQTPSAHGWEVFTHLLGSQERRVVETELWRDIDPAHKEGVGKAAALFITETDPSGFVSPSGREIKLGAFRGAAALELLRVRDALGSVDDARLDRWMPSVLIFAGELVELNAEVCKRRPERVARILLSWLTCATSPMERQLVAGSIRHAWVDELGPDLLARAQADDELLVLLLPILLDHHVPGADEVDVAASSARRADILGIRLRHPPTSAAAWESILAADEMTLRAIMGGLEFSSLSLKHLPATTLAQIYERLTEVFPTREDFDPEATDWHVHGLRETALTGLVERGAVEEIRVLRAGMPEATWLDWAISDAARVARQDWEPLREAEVDAILNDEDRGVARSSRELLDRVIEALEDLQCDLGRDRAIVGHFRNDDGSHKREDWISTELRRTLVERLEGAVVDREIVVDPLDGATGRSVDLKVETVGTGGRGRAVIEVKGSWHKKVSKSLPSQLVADYLQGEWTHGLYLVVWFDEDHHSPVQSSTQLRELLKCQAEEASDNVVDVRSFVLTVPPTRGT